MKIINPSTEIITDISEGGVKELKLIERIARTCYKSEDRISEDISSAKKMIAGLILKEHTAMIEHSILTVKFTVDRGISHELVRHRIASFAQESTRYCNYSKGKYDSQLTVINPFGGLLYQNHTISKKHFNFLTKTIAPLSEHLDDMALDESQSIFLKLWVDDMKKAEENYINATKDKNFSAQMARSLLPNSTKTEIYITANFREWRNIFQLRTAAPAHPQMREVMIPLLLKVKKLIPVIFDDFIVMDHGYGGMDTCAIEEKEELRKIIAEQ